MNNILNPAYLFKFNFYQPLLQKVCWYLISDIGFYILAFVAALEFTRQLYANATEGAEIKPLSVLVKIGVFGVIFAAPRLYVVMVDTFISQPIMMITGFISGSSNVTFQNMLDSATQAILKNSMGPMSLIKALVLSPLSAILSVVCFILMYAYIYALLIVQKIIWGMLFVVGPIFGPFIIFRPLAHLFKNWLSALLSVSFWSLFASVMIQIVAATGLDMTLNSLMGGDVNHVQVITISLAIILMTGTIVPLCGQLFGFQFSSPFSPRMLFGLMGTAAVAGFQFAAKKMLKNTPLINAAASLAKDSAPAQKGTSTPEFKVKDKTKEALSEFEPQDMGRRVQIGPSIKDKILSRGPTLNSLGKNKATMAMITEKTAQIQASMFRRLVTRLALAKNPLLPAVNEVFFGGNNVTGQVGWIMGKSGTGYNLENELVTPRAFSRVRTQKDFLKLTSKLPHFSHLSDEKRLEMLYNLNENGFKLQDIAVSMEILDHNFGKFGSLENPEGSIKKILDINNKRGFKDIIHGRYPDATDIDIWRFFKQNKNFSSVSRKDMDALSAAFSPAFILAAATHLAEKSPVINEKNSLSLLKSFMARNKAYDRFSSDDHLSAQRFIFTKTHAISPKKAAQYIKNTVLFGTLSDRQIRTIMNSNNPKDLVQIVEFAETTLAGQNIKNPYKLLRNLSSSFKEIKNRESDRNHLNAGEADILQTIDKTILPEAKCRELLQKYTPYAVMTAYSSMKDMVQPDFRGIPDGVKPTILPSTDTREDAADFIHACVRNGALDKSNTLIALETMQAIRVSENTPSQISKTSFQNAYLETAMLSSEGNFTPVFNPTDTKEFRNAFVERFIEAKGFENTPTQVAIQMLSLSREKALSPETITPEYLNNHIRPEIPSLKAHEEVFNPHVTTVQRAEYVRSFVANGGFDGISSENAAVALKETCQKYTNPAEFTPERIEAVKHEVRQAEFVRQNADALENQVFSPQDSDLYKQEFIEKYASTSFFNDLSPKESVEVLKQLLANDVQVQEIRPETVNKAFEAAFSANPTIFTDNAFTPTDTAAFKERFVENLAHNGIFNSVTPDAAASIIAECRKNVSDGSEITPQTILNAQGRGDMEGKIEKYLEDNYRIKEDYRLTPQDFYSYVEKRSDIRFDEAAPFKETVSASPAQSFYIAKNLDQAVGLTEFSREELINAIETISKDKTAQDNIISEKVRTFSQDDATRIIKNLPVFSKLEEPVIREMAKSMEPYQLSVFAKGFNDEVTGLENVDPVHDFATYLEDKHKESK